MSTTPNRRYVDRSRMLTYQRCPRARYFEHEFDGTGIVKKGASIPLVTGGVVHEGLAALLQGSTVESAVKVTRESYAAIVSERGLATEAMDSSYTTAEQGALAEALVRAWALVGLPALLEQFTVEQVEQELLFPLSNEITLMSRPDAILRERSSGDLYVLSFKTAAQFDTRKAKECQHDDQGISEVVAVEHALGERVMGVRYEFLLKGRRSEYPKGSGRWVQWSPLIRAYANGEQLAANYEWIDAESGLKRRLGYCWERFDVWDAPIGVAGWIDWLAAHDRGTLDEQVVVPMPFYRNGDELKSWVRQRAAQESDVKRHAEWVESDRKLSLTYVHQPEIVESFACSLDDMFPQNRRSCDYPSSCQFLDICYGPIPASDPLSSGSYIRRTPHHTPELVQLQDKLSPKGGPQ